MVEVEAGGLGGSVRPLRAERGHVTTFNVGLEIAGISSEVVVTAEGTPQSTDEVAKAISVVDARQIERRDEYSLIGALRPVPGVRVEQLGGPGAFSKIFIRGCVLMSTMACMMARFIAIRAWLGTLVTISDRT